MTNEAVKVEIPGGEKGRPTQFHIVDTAAIEKGALLFIDKDITTQDRSVSGGSAFVAGSRPFAGIAAHEKVANDGSTTIGVWTEGVFDILSGATANSGSLVVISGGNCI